MSRNKNEKKKFASRKFKMGSFQTITMVIVLAVVVLVNVVIARMNWSKDITRIICIPCHPIRFRMSKD